MHYYLKMCLNHTTAHIDWDRALACRVPMTILCSVLWTTKMTKTIRLLGSNKSFDCRSRCRLVATLFFDVVAAGTRLKLVDLKNDADDSLCISV